MPLALDSQDTPTKNTHIHVTKSYPLWAGKMALQLQALPALPEDAGSTPSTHMAAHGNSRPRQSGTLTLLFIHAGKTPMNIKINIKKKLSSGLSHVP